MILDKIIAHTKERVERVKKDCPTSQLSIRSVKKVSFKAALKKDKIAVIGEVKRASPSKGIITEEFDPVAIAMDYEKSGVSAVSVLTEPHYFLGKNTYLSDIKAKINLPVLRKDFIIDEYQIIEANSIGADAILLIAAVLEKQQMKYYLQMAHELEMECLVEAHDQAEIEKALSAGGVIIGVNNRDLKTFEVNMENSLDLRKFVPQEKIFVSESGIQTHEDVVRLQKAGVDAMLIGETLMRATNKIKVLGVLLGEK